MTWRLILILAGLGACSAASALADDVVPPCWRGQPGTTFQLWNFNANNNPASSTQVANPNGGPQASMALGLGGAGWLDSLFLFGTNQGVWDLGRNGTMSLAIPNSLAPAGSWKFVWVQVTQYRDGIYNEMAAVAIPGATRVGGQVKTNATTGFGGKWVTDQSIWLLEPCPASESVVVTAGTNGVALDQVVVDTRCSSADSGDISPPCWRGQPGSTLQDWSFHTALNPAVPEQKNNPGSPQAAIQVGTLGAGWTDQLAGFGCRQGFWDLGIGGTITLSVPNTAGSATSYKYLRIQITQFQDSLTYSQLASLSLPPGAVLVSRQQQAVEAGLFGQWVVDQSVWRIAPCPASESIVIASGTTGALIDQVVVDTLCLDFACPSDIAASADPGQCSKANVTWTTPLVDGCKVAAVSCTPANGSTFNVGHTSVACTITDGQGGTLTCHFSVNVADTELPVAHCPADIIVPTVHALCGTNVAFTATATDNCPGATVTCSPTNGAFFPLGATTVACTAHDASGNNSTPCSFTVRVVDYSGDLGALCWRGKPGSTYQHWAFSTSANPASPEQANSPGQPKAAIQIGTLGVGWLDQLLGFGCKQGFWDLGNNGSITLSLSNFAGSASSYKYVRIQVTQFSDPLTYNQLTAISLTPGATLVSRQQSPIETAVLGQWIIDESVWRITPCPASETIVLTSGTSGALIDQVVVDTLCIHLPCPTNLVASADPGQCSKAHVSWPAPVVDGCIVTAVTCTPTNGSTFPVGVTPVTCVVTDAASQPLTCPFLVTITDGQNPVARCTNITVTLDGTGHAAITADQVDNGSTDNCGIVSKSVVPNTFTSANLGPNSVVLTVMDAAGHPATCNATVTVTVAADLSVRVASSPNPVTVGSFITYAVTVSNAGPNTATGVRVSEVLSPGQILVAVTNGVNASGCPSPGPVAWWPAEGNASDAAGANPGALNGGATFAAGEVGQAFHFDGLSGFVSVPDAPALRPANLTIEGWIKIQDPNGIHVVIGKAQGAGSADSYSLWLASGVLFAAVSDASGPGPALSYPVLPASSVFVSSDLINFPSLAGKLKNPSPSDKVSQYLTNQLAAATRALLSSYAGGVDAALLRALVSDFNRIIQSGPLYDAARFVGVTLSSESQYMLARNPQGSDLVRLNRMLLRDAYPAEITSDLFPQLNQRFHVGYTFDQATHAQGLYVNGALVASGLANKTIAYDNHALLIGADLTNGSPGLFYQGDIDELTLYPRALTGTELAGIYTAAAGGKCRSQNPFLMADLASGATEVLTLLATPTNCAPASATATVSADTTDLNPANNTAASPAVTVQDVLAGQLQLTAQRVTVNNNSVRLCWPLTCAPYLLQATSDLTPPAVWTPVPGPVLVVDGLNCTVVPATQTMQYYRLTSP